MQCQPKSRDQNVAEVVGSTTSDSCVALLVPLLSRHFYYYRTILCCYTV